ncbi:hypothetical protein M0812_01998 [Anaeramoeba flamelloides]|uniref:Gamma-secretase-activating protein C-terminal domain-containing protein n=1 Tax=Anaeramoeba flamelloides TaxID=1746091 RepID=A0AAV7Z5E9_9EUKA|nr:hypothetical protein M0812_01998 [Anaeramoeba flamelloides]
MNNNKINKNTWLKKRNNLQRSNSVMTQNKFSTPKLKKKIDVKKINLNSEPISIYYNNNSEKRRFNSLTKEQISSPPLSSVSVLSSSSLSLKASYSSSLLPSITNTNNKKQIDFNPPSEGSDSNDNDNDNYLEVDNDDVDNSFNPNFAFGSFSGSVVNSVSNSYSHSGSDSNSLHDSDSKSISISNNSRSESSKIEKNNNSNNTNNNKKKNNKNNKNKNKNKNNDNNDENNNPNNNNNNNNNKNNNNDNDDDNNNDNENNDNDDENNNLNLNQTNYPTNFIKNTNKNSKNRNKSTLSLTHSKSQKNRHFLHNNNCGGEIELCGLFNVYNIINILNHRYTDHLTKINQQKSLENLNYHIKIYLRNQKYEIENIFQFLKNFLLYSNNHFFNSDGIYDDNDNGNKKFNDNKNGNGEAKNKKVKSSENDNEDNELSTKLSKKAKLELDIGNIGHVDIINKRDGGSISDNSGYGGVTDNKETDKKVKKLNPNKNEKDSKVNFLSDLESNSKDDNIDPLNTDLNTDFETKLNQIEIINPKINSNSSRLRVKNNSKNGGNHELKRKFVQQIQENGFYLFPLSKKWEDQSIPSLQILQKPNFISSDINEINTKSDNNDHRDMRIRIKDLYSELHHLENIKKNSASGKSKDGGKGKGNTGGNVKKDQEKILFSIFQKFENFYSALEELNLPFPDGFHYFFIRLGYQVLPRHIFLQYVDSKIFRVDRKFLNQISNQLNNKDLMKKNNKKSKNGKEKPMNSPSTIKFINHLTLMINSKNETEKVLEKNLNYTKFLFEYYSSMVSQVFQVKQKPITVPINEFHNFYYYPLSFCYDQLEFDSHRLDKEMIQYLKSNLIIYVPIIDFNKID